MHSDRLLDGAHTTIAIGPPRPGDNVGRRETSQTGRGLRSGVVEYPQAIPLGNWHRIAAPDPDPDSSNEETP